MLTSKARDILFKIVVIIISITLFGFITTSAAVDPGLVQIPGGYTDGWVDVIIYGEASSSEGNFIWNQAEVTMPITGFDSQGRAKFYGQAFTSAQGNARRGPMTVRAGWPVYWSIEGTVALPPDCTIEMKIDETWYPGWTIGCAPLIGCITDPWPAAYHPGAAFKIPWDKAWGTAISRGSAMGVPYHLTVIIYHVITGGGSSDPSGIDPLGCEYHLMFPVIPQAEK